MVVNSEFLLAITSVLNGVLIAYLMWRLTTLQTKLDNLEHMVDRFMVEVHQFADVASTQICNLATNMAGYEVPRPIVLTDQPEPEEPEQDDPISRAVKPKVDEMRRILNTIETPIK